MDGLYMENMYVKLMGSSLSTRTATILWRNGISYLHELSNFCEETLMQLRNIGPGAVEEIKEFCAKNDVYIYNRDSLSCKEIEIELTPAEYAKVFQYGISDKQELFNTDGVLLEREFGTNTVLCKKLKRIKLYMYEQEK